MTLADHVRTLGRGPGRSRSLTREEAWEAMGLMLSTDTAPEAIGATLMLLRMKGETADEIAGLASRAQAAIDFAPAVDLDWPSYAAGRTRGEPWFLLSARLVAMAGYRVLIHGWNGNDDRVRDGMNSAGIGIARSIADATRILDRDGIAYFPLENMHPDLMRLLCLRDVLGLRSCMNTVCRMLNPARARVSVQGVFHPSYRLLQADAAELLEWSSLSVIKGGGGEFERHPSKEIAAFGLRQGAGWQEVFPALVDETRRLASSTGPKLEDVWQGKTNSEFERMTVLGTAALAFQTLGVRKNDAFSLAEDCWCNRTTKTAA